MAECPEIALFPPPLSRSLHISIFGLVKVINSRAVAAILRGMCALGFCHVA